MKEAEIETPDPFYNCSECSSPIEIIFLDNKNIEFKCFNKKKSHNMKMSIEEYINKMKINHIGINNEKCMINGHYKNYECYCLDCNAHLCELCLKSRDHLLHDKINIKEILPRKNELNLVDNMIKDIENKKECKNLKRLYEIIYKTCINSNNNYYYCININYILVNHIENNKSLKDKLTEEEYKNIIKISIRKERRNKVNEDIINKIKEENEQMKIKYENIIINLKKQLSEETNSLKNPGFTVHNQYLINNNFKNQNVIKGELEIKLSEINNKITLFNTEIKEGIDVYLDNKKINMIKDDNIWKIDYNFEKDGKYIFYIVINIIITNMKGFFSKCFNIIYLDFSNFNSSHVTNMGSIFNKCSQLKEIKGINKFITNKVINMKAMFQSCKVLEYLDLSNFNTENVTDMGWMFNECHKLKEIKGINNFITNKVKNMTTMFQQCNELEYLDLSNFNTENVTNMEAMFNKCCKLKEIKGINQFITNNVTNMRIMFQFCIELEYLDLSNFNTENVINMKCMFYECNKLKYLNLLNFTINCDTEYMLSFREKDKCNFITNNKYLLELYNSY